MHNPALPPALVRAVLRSPAGPNGGTSPAHSPKPSHPPATPRVYAPPYVCDEPNDPIGRMETVGTITRIGTAMGVRQRHNGGQNSPTAEGRRAQRSEHGARSVKGTSLWMFLAELPKRNAFRTAHTVRGSRLASRKRPSPVRGFTC
jgi:hypothetical protein